MKLRIGQGFDAHRFQAGDHVIIGGVLIPFDQGLAAHSDGDVLMHALADAILGAAALGDIGRHFPDTDPAWRGADSRALLRHCVKLAEDRELVPVNADATLVAQRPRFAPHIEAMAQNIAADLGLARDCVNVKATTTEGMGFTGRAEGIAAQAAVLLAAPGAAD